MPVGVAGRMGTCATDEVRLASGFFLEYDRGTERACEYAAKFDAYYGYLDSHAAARDYVGFPTVLVLTTVAPAEERIAYQAYLAAERHSRRLPLLLTTIQQIGSQPEGILGPVWRAPRPLSGRSPDRNYWLPGGRPSGLIRYVRSIPNLPSRLGWMGAPAPVERTIRLNIIDGEQWHRSIAQDV